MRIFSSPQEWALCGMTMIWGGTFYIISLVMREAGPFWFVGIRFSFASLGLLLCSFPLLGGITKRELFGGILLGCTVFLGFGLQTMGLATIPSAKAAFITAFYVPLVPLFELLLMRHRPGKWAIVGMCLAFFGVILLTNPQAVQGGMGVGEMVTILCAIAFAIEIVLMGMIVPGTNPRRLALVEVVVTAILGFLTMPMVHETAVFSKFVLLCAAGLGLCTALIQSVVTWAQKTVSPTRATIIYTGEPVWAGLIGYLAGERLALSSVLGCAFVVLGILVSNRKNEKMKK